MLTSIVRLAAPGSSLLAALAVSRGPSLPAPSTVAFEAQHLPSWLLQSDSGDDEAELFVILLVGFLGGLYLIYDGFDAWKLGRLVQDTPTSKVRSMPVGRVELEGTVRKREGSVTPPLSDAECVYVSWKAEKREKRVDDDGDVHYTWNAIGSGTRAFTFDLEDDTGAVRIRADVDDPEFDINAGDHSLQRTYSRGESAPTDVRRFVRGGGDPSAVSLEDDDDGGLVDGVMDLASDLATDSLSDTGNRRRYSETVLPVGSHVYVLGGAEPREGATMEASQADLLEVREDPGSGEFVVSDSREEELQESYSRWGPLKTLGGLVLSAGCLFLLLWNYRLHELVV
jgi:hypothetical protein